MIYIYSGTNDPIRLQMCKSSSELLLLKGEKEMILEQDSALIKNFITKKDPSMEFNEMQAIIKMPYETYLATQKMKGEELCQ